MADNITVNQGSGGATIRAENVSGSLYVPVTKIHNGADDTDGGSVTATNPLAVQLSQSNAAASATNPIPTQDAPQTSGGCSIGKVLSTADTTATSLKASAGQVYSFTLANANAAARYAHFYNKASAPTVGTDVPVFTVMIPAGGVVMWSDPKGIAFATGIAWGLTTGAADNNSTGVAAAEITGLIGYK